MRRRVKRCDVTGWERACVRSQPIAYEADGRVFVAIGAGNGTFIASTGAPDMLPEGGQLFVFELP